MDKMIDLIEKCFAVGWTLFWFGSLAFITVGMGSSAFEGRWTLFWSLGFGFLIFLAAILIGLQKCVTIFYCTRKISALNLKKAAHFISLIAFLYMGILFSVVSFIEPKENTWKLAIFGWIAFVFMTVSYWFEYQQFKRKR